MKYLSCQLSVLNEHLAASIRCLQNLPFRVACEVKFEVLVKFGVMLNFYNDGVFVIPTAFGGVSDPAELLYFALVPDFY